MVTNAFIDGLARELRFPSLAASNMARKIQLLLSELLADGRTRASASRAIVSLAMEAHRRAMTLNGRDDRRGLAKRLKVSANQACEQWNPDGRLLH